MLKVKTYRSEAPTLLLCFEEASFAELIAALDEIAERFQFSNLDPFDWHFPDGQHLLVSARFLDDFPPEMSETGREDVCAEVGPRPTAFLRLVFGRSAECSRAARVLALHLLQKFHGAAAVSGSDGGVWTASELRNCDDKDIVFTSLPHNK